MKPRTGIDRRSVQDRRRVNNPGYSWKEGVERRGGKEQRMQVERRAEWARRSGIDRRSGEDRRTAYDLDYYFKIGVERRSRIERRKRSEQRKVWIRVTDWSSVYAGSRRSLRR